MAALISNWSQVEKALDAANNAAGTAQEEQDKYMKSMQGHIDQLTATWQVFANDLMNSDFLKGLISGATSLLDIVDKIVNGIGTLPTLIGAIAAGLSFKNIGVFKTMNGEITLLGNNLSKVVDDFGKLGFFGGVKNLFAGDARGLYDNEFIKNLSNDKKSILQYSDAVNKNNMSKDLAYSSYMKTASADAQNYVKSIDAAKLSVQEFDKQQRLVQIGTVAQSKGLSNVSKIIGEYNQGFTNTSHTQAEFLKTVTQSNQGLGNYLSGLNGAKGSLSGYIGSLISAKAATIAMQAATMALNMVLSMGVAFAVSAAISAIMKLADSMDTSFAKATERAKESKRVFEESASDVDEVQKRLDDVKAKISESKSKSLTDSKDIANLETQKELLEAQLKIKQQIAKTNEEKANKDAETALTQERGYNIETLKDKDNVVDRSYFLSGSGGAVNSSLGYGNIIEETRKKQELLNEATKKYNELVIQHSKTKNSDKWKQEEKEIEQYSQYIEKLSTEVNSNISDISEQVDTLVGKSGYENVVKDAQSLYKDVEDGTQKIQTLSQITEGMGLDLSKILGGEGQENKAFETRVDDYIKKINELNEAKNKIADGTLSDEDKKNLFYDFPELKGQTDNLDSAIGSLAKSMNSDIVKDFTSQMNNIHTEEGVASMQAIQDAVMGVGESMVDVEELTSGLKTAQEDFSALGTAINESNSATGLSVESMEKLETMYSGLKGYDSATLFERTANGIKLNADELSRLNKLYEDNQSQEFASSLDNLNSKLALEKEALKEAEEARNENAIQLHENNIESIQNQITQVENLSSMWQSATSAYNEYVQAQSGGTHHDTLESFAKDRENIEKMMNAGWGNNEAVTKYWDAIFGEERTMSNKEALAQFNEELEKTGHALSDYLVFDNGELQASGIKTLFEDISSGLGEDFAKMENGTNILNLQGDNLQKIADYLGVDIGLVQMFADAMNDMPDFDIKFDGVETGTNGVSENIAKIIASVDEAKKKLSELQKSGQISDKINLDFDMNTASLSDFENQIKQLKSIKIDAKVNPEGAAALDTLIQKTEHEYYVKINAETGGQLDEAVEKVNTIQNKLDEAKKNAGDNFDIKATVDGDAEIKNLATELSNMDKNARISVGIDVEDGDVQGVLNQLKSKPESIQVPINYVIGEKPEEVVYKDQQVQVTYNIDAPAEPKYETQNPNVFYHMHAPDPPTYNNIEKTITYTIKVVGNAPSGAGGVDGTAHSTGTAYAKGTAFKSGYWGTKESGFALGGEEGQEILVRDGHWYTIGENSAEFFGYKKGDIIFNAEQSKQILEKGKITHGKKRGTSLATGTAFSDGTAFARGSKSKKKSSKNKEDKALQSFQDWIAKLFDWIEIRVKRQTERIDRFTKRADNALKSGRYRTAASNYNNAINATATQIEYEQTASNKYQAEANKILNRAVKKGLVSRKKANGIRTKVANGTLDIAEYGERMREVIKDYQTWAEKAIDAKDAIEDLHSKIRDYIQDLKDVRDEQRKNRVDRLNALQDIGISSYTSDAGTYHKLYNGQLGTQNATIKRINAAYSAEVNNVISDNKFVARSANKSIRSDIKSNTKSLKSKKTKSKTKTKIKAYNKALQNAQKAIKAKKKIASADLKVIRKNSIDTYERLYAYNLSFDNLETARLERATQYATNSADYFENISKQYEKLDNANKNKMDLNESKANNLTGKQANKYLDKVVKGYDKIIANDKAEIKQYNKTVKSASKTITNKSGRGKSYDNANSKDRKEVNNYIKLAKARVKSKVAIGSAIIKNLAKYNVKGYVSNAFLNACLNYNNALEWRRQAQAQLEIDEQTRLQERNAIAAEKFSNIEQTYNNTERSINSSRSLLKEKQNTKTTIGKTLTAKDYQKTIDYNAESIANYKKEIKALNKEMQKNLKLYGENSQEYLDNLNSIEEYKIKLQETITEQEELNNLIVKIPYDKIADALDKLDSLADYHKSISDLKSAKSQDLELVDYLQQISDNDSKIFEYTKQREQLEKDLQEAQNTGGYYGGKSVTDWRKELDETLTNINKLEEDNEKLKDSLRDDVFWRTYERAHDAAQRLSDILSGMANLLSDDMFFDKNGDITEWGIDQIATLTKQFENARDEVENYSNDIDNLNYLYDVGYYTQLEYTEKLGELQKKLLDSAKDMKSYLYSIKDMYKEMDKSELDALFKLIELRKEALSKKKSYYDYDRNIKSKTKDIQELQSQIAALEGVSDAASRAKRAKLQEELSEKQDDLNDTLFDHNIQLSQDALDDLKDILQTEFDDKWEDITQDLDKMQELLTAANDLTSANMSNINDSLDKLLSFYGINTVKTGVMDSYASGSKRISKTGRALTNENGDEIIVTDYGLIVPLKAGDGVVPADMTKKLYSMAMGVVPNIQTPQIKMPTNLSNPNIEVHQHYDSLINIEGSADAATVKDLERMSKQLLETSYQYTTNRIKQDNIRTGGLRRI